MQFLLLMRFSTVWFRQLLLYGLKNQILPPTLAIIGEKSIKLKKERGNGKENF